jgi:hypothetical protein
LKSTGEIGAKCLILLGAQGRNRTTDIVIFSYEKVVSPRFPDLSPISAFIVSAHKYVVYYFMLLLTLPRV